jgi:Domain of unknown function (DUF4421)
MPGYAHTFVIKEKFFITLSAFLGANFQQQQYYVGNESIDKNKFIIAPKASARVGLGYNGKRFYTGLAAIGDNYTLPLGANEKLNYLMGNGTFYFGMRFNMPKAFEKVSSFMDKIPGILIQRIN